MLFGNSIRHHPRRADDWTRPENGLNDHFLRGKQGTVWAGRLDRVHLYHAGRPPFCGRDRLLRKIKPDLHDSFCRSRPLPHLVHCQLALAHLQGQGLVWSQNETSRRVYHWASESGSGKQHLILAMIINKCDICQLHSIADVLEISIIVNTAILSRVCLTIRVYSLCELIDSFGSRLHLSFNLNGQLIFEGRPIFYR